MPSDSRGAKASAIAVLSVLLLVGCGDGTTEPAANYQLAIVSGDQQVAPAGSQLPRKLEVRVLDGDGRPVRDVKVGWSVEEPGGFVSTASSPSITDAGGRASTHRTLGQGAGVHGTTASIEDGRGRSVRFTSVAQIQGATQIGPSPADNGNLQRDTVLATLAPFRILVRDHDDRPVSGVTVQWQHFDGSLSTEVSITNAEGIAETSYTFGALAGTKQVQARVPGLPGSPVLFEVAAELGAPRHVIPADGGGLPGRVTAMVDPYLVRVTDGHDNPIAGVVIDWTVTAGGGSISPAHTVTEPSPSGTDPRAATRHTLGPDEGMHSVTATATEVPGAPQVVFETRAVTEIVWVLSSGYDWYYGYVENAFAPAETVVPAGSTVAWVWSCCGQHDVTFEDNAAGPVSSTNRKEGVHFRTFEEPGVYRYRCLDHSSSFTDGQSATVRVEAKG